MKNSPMLALENDFSEDLNLYKHNESLVLEYLIHLVS